jgi:hypothetical protein
MNRRDMLIAGLLAAGLVALLVPLASLGVDAHHDGIMLKPALDVLSGQVLFRDTFSQYGALTTYLQVIALWFQPTLLALRLMTAAAYGVTLFFVYATWRLILPRSLTLVACGLFILFIPGYEKNWLDEYWVLLPWSSVYAMMFQVLAVYALLNIIRHEQAGPWGVMLGMAGACVLWCRQPVGVMTVGCIAVIWLALHWTGWTPPGRAKRSLLLGTLGGFFGVHALILGGIWLSGAGPEWWYQNFVWPRKYALGAANANWNAYAGTFLHGSAVIGLLVVLLAALLPGILPRLGARLSPRFAAAYYVCLGLVLAWQHERVLQLLALRDGGWTGLLPAIVILQALGSIGLGFTRRRTEKPAEYYLVAALAALSLGSLTQYYPVPDSWHIMWALAPAFGLVIFSFWRWSGWPAPVVAVVLTVAFLPSIYRKFQSAHVLLTQPHVTLTHPAALRGMKVLPARAESFGQIASVLDRVLAQRPDMPSALIGNDALFLCFTTNRTNPLPYYVTWGGLTGPADNIRRWTYIGKVRPLLFFHKADWSGVNDFYRGSRYVPIAYIAAEALEIAVPQELADAMGVTTYGAPKTAGLQAAPR